MEARIHDLHMGSGYLLLDTAYFDGQLSQPSPRPSPEGRATVLNVKRRMQGRKDQLEGIGSKERSAG